VIFTIDLEATGTDPVKDRIVQIAFAVDDEPPRQRLINPEMPIPPASTAVHGITDEMVKDAPTFRQIAKSLFDHLSQAEVLVGYNMRRLDLPMLAEEFGRCGIAWPTALPKLLDGYRIFQHFHPRDLGAAVRIFCNREQTDAHQASGDVIDTRDVVNAMRDLYGSEHDLFALSIDPADVDLAGKLKRNEDGAMVYNFGQHRGATVESRPDFAYWMLSKDFPYDTRRHLEAELERIQGKAAA